MRFLVTLIFLQMLPATLVVPAIRPLFASIHGGNVSAMHAFMAINMAAAVLTAPWIGRLADRTRRPGRTIALLVWADAILLATIAMPLPTAAVLALRFVEGAAHVGATTLLMHEAARRARLSQEGKIMGMAGAAIIFAVAGGSALGGVTVTLSPAAPFVLAAIIAAAVALAAARLETVPSAPLVRVTSPPRWNELALPISAAFIERFAVGCIVVSFALLAHEIHGLSDAAIGWHYFALTFTFAIVVAPAGRLADRFPRMTLLGSGALVYAASLFGIALLPRQAVLLAMIAAGIGAAVMFAPALATVAAGPRERRGAAMALFNAAGCLGMMLGPIASGIVIATLRDAGPNAYRGPICLAGAATVLWMIVAAASQWKRFTVQTHEQPAAASS
jgi:MFS family permease